jgi:PLP dependent protein
MNHPPREPARPHEESARATDGASALCINHDRVLARISSAARAAGRDPADVSLLAVSKTFGPDDVLQLAACGQRAFAESYLQEALDKMSACRDRWPNRPSERSASLEWHFIGPIQSNKTRPIAEAFDWVHSLDRDRVAERLSAQRPPGLAPLQVCIQVNLSGEASKSGCDPQHALTLAQRVACLPRLRLRGLMTIPEPTGDRVLQRERFGSLARLLADLRAAGLPVDTLSMGMSDDLESAIAEGATIVRVGTALFGRRPEPQAPPGTGDAPVGPKS